MERTSSAERVLGTLETNSSYRLLFEKNPQLMWVFDEDSLRFLAVNDAAIRHYGYTREEFLRMTVKDVRPQSELPGMLEFRSQLTLAFMEFGAPTQWTHRKKDGTLIEVECKGASILFNGANTRLIIIEDITERIKNAARLREMAENFQIFFDGASEGIAIHDAGTILAANAALATLLGCAEHGCVGESLLDYAAPESRYQLLSCFRTASVAPVEFSLLRNDGSRVRVLGTSRSVRFHGRMAHVLLLHDISARAFEDFSDCLRGLDRVE